MAPVDGSECWSLDECALDEDCPFLDDCLQAEDRAREEP